MRKIWDNKMIIWTQNEMLDVRILFSCPGILKWRFKSFINFLFVIFVIFSDSVIWISKYMYYQNSVNDCVNHHIIFVNVVRSVFTCWVNFDPIYIHIFCIPCTAPIFDKLLLSDAIFGQ